MDALTAMKQARDALIYEAEGWDCDNPLSGNVPQQTKDAIAALDAAIQQAEQAEPAGSEDMAVYDAIAANYNRTITEDYMRAMLPEPFDWCYEWDGPYGSREFSSNQRNGRRPDRSVGVFNKDQMLAYGRAIVERM